MKKQIRINKTRIQRAERVRSMIHGTAQRPRISIFKSNQHIYIQCIDDDAQKTIISGSSKGEKTSRKEYIVTLAKKVATQAKEKGISKGVFDRGSYKFHGTMRALADALKENGISI